MTTFGIPYLLEDRTGDVLNTEYDELYDRMFFGVSSSSPSSAPGSPCTIEIFELGSRSTRSFRGGQNNFGKDPVVVLDFTPGAGMGTVFFARHGVSMSIDSWMQGSDPQKNYFTCSDGERYYWTYKANTESEWACTTASGYVAAQYKLHTPDEPKYASSSGNVFMVYESYGHIATELLASLTIVRYVQRINNSA